MEAKAFSFTHHTKVCAGGTEQKNYLRPRGGLAESAEGSPVSKPISLRAKGRAMLSQ